MSDVRNAQPTTSPVLSPPGSSRTTKGRRPWSVTLPALVLVVIVVVAIFGPLFVGYDPRSADTAIRLLPPGSDTGDGVALLGTDQLGRDLFAQMIQGARVSLIVGTSTVIVAGFAGTVLGLAAGYFGRFVDSAVMRLVDIQLAFPPILLAILLAAALGPSLLNLVIALALTRWVKYARVVRAATLEIRERGYVASARLLGVSNFRILTRHVLPFVMTPLVIIATAEFGLVVLAEAGLSFLGLGTPAGTPSWGLTIANGRSYLTSAWWISAVPGLALATLVMCVGTLGDALRDRLDPHMSDPGQS